MPNAQQAHNKNKAQSAMHEVQQNCSSLILTKHGITMASGPIRTVIYPESMEYFLRTYIWKIIF